MIDWISDRLHLSGAQSRPLSEAERSEGEAVSRLAGEAVARAHQTVDTWNERFRESWRPPQHDA